MEEDLEQTNSSSLTNNTLSSCPQGPEDMFHIFNSSVMGKFIEDHVTESTETVKIEDVFERSKKFPIQFPVYTPRLENILQTNSFKNELRKQGKVVSKEVLERMVNSTYPMVHEKVLDLFFSFINYKKKWGQLIEKGFYKEITVDKIVDKLLTKRPAVFKDPWDQYLLLDGTPGFGGFENIGQDSNPKQELSIDKLNSYDEMRLASLISVSSMAFFINDGSKNNCGVIGNGVTHELEGVIIGQVGPRFEKEGYMDWVDCIVSKDQNTRANGYGKDNGSPNGRMLQSWANIWGLEYLPTFDEISEEAHNYEYINIKDVYLNKRAYKGKIQMLSEIMLTEASCKSKSVSKKAYLHVSGLGLNNSWMITPLQSRLYMEAWADTIQRMSVDVTDNIACLNFSCIAATRIHGVKSGDKFPNTDITITFTKRDMLERVPRGCLLVCNYPYNSNSLPGNEFWLGSLSTSGATAAACSTPVSEMHNPFINPRVSSTHLMVASRGHGAVVPVKEYIAFLRENC